MAKLLEEKCQFGPAKDWDYKAVRQEIFSKAQRAYPVVREPDLIYRTERGSVLEAVASSLGIARTELETHLYGDLPENQVLIHFDDRIRPPDLVRRYNVALAQALLYRAVRLQVYLFSDYKVVFKYIKLARLIHLIRSLEPSGYKIVLDGPASLFRNTQKYGVQMALFLPGLLLANKWKMEAEVNTDWGPKGFGLDHTCGLTSHYRREHPFDSRIEESFARKFNRKTRDWVLEREGEVIDLGDIVLIPDFTFRHKDGRVAMLEIIGFWTPEYLKYKLEKIRKAGRKNLIVAVNEKLNCSKEDFEGEVIFYKTGIRLSALLERLEKVGKFG